MLPVCVPVLAPGAGPMPTVAMPGHWVCLEDLAALSSGPLCSATRLGEPAPVPTGQCLDMRLGTGDTKGDTAPAPRSNRTWIFGVGIRKADRDGFRVLSLGGYPAWKGISGSQHSLSMEGKEKQGTWRRGMGDQDQQDSHPDNSPSSPPKHWAREGLEVDLAL